jgi:hypothetical protein
MIELLLPSEFDTLEYSWVKATIGICTLADYSVAKKCQHFSKRQPQKQEFITTSLKPQKATHLKKDNTQKQSGLHAKIIAQPPQMVVQRYCVQAVLAKDNHRREMPRLNRNS